MTKIPVGETILYAYRFTFGHLGAIIGLIWLPMVLVTVAGFFSGQRYYADMASAFSQNDFAAMGPAIIMILGYLGLSLLLYAMMYVSVMELALGTRKPGAIVHFAFGRIEWRMFRSILALIGVVLLPVAFIVGAAVFASSALGASLGKGPASLALGAAMLVFDLALIYAVLRFVFLLAPVAVAEQGRVLERAWTLSSGNFWRIFAVLAATVGPIIVLTAAAQILLLGPVSFIPNLSPTSVQTASQIQSVNMPLVAGISFFVSPLTLGLMLGAASFAYKSLTRAANGKLP